jgi:type I restriction enzyme S subunit
MEVREASADYLVQAVQRVPKGYKQTEVGVIPEDWEVPKIESIISEISMGPFGSDIKVSNFVSEGIPVLSGANVRSERLKDSFANFVSPAKAKSLKKAVANRGDIVVTHRGTLGQVSYIPEDSAFDRYVISQSQFRVRFIENLVTPCWVVLYFHTEQGAGRLLEGKGHTGVPAIAQPTKTFRYLHIPLPPLPEQRAIAEALSDADGLIGSLEQLLAKKRQIKQSAMQELLSGKKRLPGFSGEWEVKRLGDVCRIATGKKDVNEGNPDGQFPFFTCSRSHTYSDSYSFDTEAILIAGNGDVGNLHYYMGKFEAYQRTYVLSEFSANVNYLWQQLSAYLAESLGLGKIGSSIPYIKKENLIDFVFDSSVDEKEQTAIATILSDMDTELAALEVKLTKARFLKQGMMQELLTGRIRLV